MGLYALNNTYDYSYSTVKSKYRAYRYRTLPYRTRVICPRTLHCTSSVRVRVPYPDCMDTCILLWILYGSMVDFSFIVSLYVSDLPNVTIQYPDCAHQYYGTRTVYVGEQYPYEYRRNSTQ